MAHATLSPQVLLWEYYGTCKAGDVPLLSVPRCLAAMLGIHFWWQCPNLLWAPSPPALFWDESAGSTSLGIHQHSKAMTAAAGTCAMLEKYPIVPAFPASWAPLLTHPLDVAPFPGSPSPVPWPTLRRIFLACFSLTATSCALMALLMLTVCKREVIEGVRWEGLKLPYTLRPSGSAMAGSHSGPQSLLVPAGC